MRGEGRPKISKIVTERYGRAEGAKKNFYTVNYTGRRGGGSATDFWKKKRYVIIGRSLRRPLLVTDFWNMFDYSKAQKTSQLKN